MNIYVVQPGDTVQGIAMKTGVSEESVVYVNQLVYPYNLAVGQALLLLGERQTQNAMIPGLEPAVLQQGSVKPVKSINGYAYPFISQWVLDQTLPYLTSLSVFSYSFTVQGDLVPPEVNDTRLIESAVNAGTNPILTLVPLDSTGRFNNYLITALINNSEARANLTANLLRTMQEKGFKGVDVDFEYILASDRDEFTSFVRELTNTMNSRGYTVSVALAPKVSADQKGLLYEGKDYAGLGAAANSVLLMTYEWGYTYGPPMAVAPISHVRRVVEYALTEIPAEKIDLGIPNYGYDWQLPFKAGETRARTMGNIEAVQQAIAVGAEIKFDETAQSPYYTYMNGGDLHEVWFEDVRSMRAKFELIKEFNLRGAGYWHIMQLFRANWLLADSTFNIKKG
ncbi:MAG: LysM peptidoglycan-binding domain-containing protein [Firmicutes bacterium]|nr:LysM peptidoglycan-binding domain-containing protein [Bacillota bacterium]